MEEHIRLKKNGTVISSDSRKPSPAVIYRTKRGKMFQGFAEEVLQTPSLKRYLSKVQLVLTSPPFPLNRKKKYGNLQGDDYIEWMADFAPILRDFVKPKGSIVIEMGNAWEPGKPVMSTLALKALLAFLERGRLNLCQQFIAYNKARLPSPAQWVNVERIRVKDAYTHIWWMSPSTRPKASNRRVLSEYSDAMKDLLSSRKYNAGKRPSEHDIGKESFLTDNRGAIPSNVLVVSNTRATDQYMEYCKERELPLHPARMAPDIPEFFINFLTEPGDIVLDPFAGSNMTGNAAEKLNRRWLSIEKDLTYARSSKARFTEPSLKLRSRHRPKEEIRKSRKREK